MDKLSGMSENHDIGNIDHPLTGSTPSFVYGPFHFNVLEIRTGVFQIHRQWFDEANSRFEAADQAVLVVEADGSGRLEESDGTMIVEVDSWQGAVKSWPYRTRSSPR